LLVIIEAHPYQPPLLFIAAMPAEKNQRGSHLATMTFPIRWGDMDALAHVNNVMYLRYFEESRLEWMMRYGMHLNNKSEGMILLKTTATYKKPVTYPANVVVDLYAGRTGNTSFDLLNTLTVEGDNEPACEAEFVIVWFDYINNKPKVIPEFLRDLLRGGKEGPRK
jgi:acyl-CoA thioester hydrolase